IGPGAEWLFALTERQWPPFAVAITDTVRLGRDGPGILKESVSGFLCETVEIKPRHHAQFQRPRISRRKIAGQRAAGARTGLRFTYAQHVAGGELAAGKSAQRSEAVK